MPTLALPVALTIPDVTVWFNPKGFPTASTVTADFETVRVSDLNGGEVRSLDLDDGEVRLLVSPYDFPFELSLVRELHLNLIRIFDDMIIREDVSVFVNYDARA